VPSPQHGPLTRHFYFPASPRHRGIVAEAGLLAARDAARASPQPRGAGDRRIVPPAEGVLSVSLFCYAEAALPALLDAWVEGDEAICAWARCRFDIVARLDGRLPTRTIRRACG